MERKKKKKKKKNAQKTEDRKSEIGHPTEIDYTQTQIVINVLLPMKPITHKTQ